MKITLKKADPAGHKTPALIVFLFSDDKPDLAGRPELEGFKGIIQPRLESREYRAKHLSLLTLYPESKAGPERLILMGLGKAKDCDPVRLRQAAAKGVKAARGKGLASASLLLPPAQGRVAGTEAAAEAVALGAGLGLYSFDEFKTKNQAGRKKPFKALTLLRTEGRAGDKIQAAVKTGEVIAEATARTRDLINRPANVLFPETLAREAAGMAKAAGLKKTVLDQAQAGKRGLGAFLAVAQGSARPGRVIILEYKGAGAKVRPVALVGKAITFDSGGLSLKRSEGLSWMKTDMSGGAVVLSVLSAAARLGLKINLVGVVPAAENMPDGGAYRPGDILKTMSGQTVEVISADAEGRLIMADALTLVQEDYHPTVVIDIATLTGACLVALGEKCAGLMGNDRGLLTALKKASEATGERVWEMPLFEGYFEKLKSEAADFKNSGGRNAGTITGGLFLKQFIQKKTKWAHLDIAGPARTEKAEPDTPAGATGFGVNLLLRYLRDL
ncbi:MAG: leucyl aminopeptidase [Thermodesulfobacteriota bacterium]